MNDNGRGVVAAPGAFASMSVNNIFGPLFGAPAVDAEVGDAAWVRAMLDFERALASVQGRLNLIPGPAADAIAAAAKGALDEVTIDPTRLGGRALTSGNPVVPLVRDLVGLVPDHAKPYVHLGATSQDVLDTAACLVASRALAFILDDLRRVADECARLARRYRVTVIAGRTLGQQAVPTTFGLKCAGWLVAVDEAAARLVEVRASRLAVQLGGAAGTLAALGTDGIRVTAALASELGLAEPVLPWHTDRTRVADLAGALGSTAGVLAKVAGDVVLLAQTEVAEVSEAVGGGSSAMPHKHNPVRAVLASAAARRVPGLVATLLASMAHEHERAAGAWHAEWETLSELLRLVGGAAHHTADLLTGLQVHPEQMRANVDDSDGLLMAESVAGRLAPAMGRSAAHDLVAKVCERAVLERVTLRAALLDEPAVRAHLNETSIDAALDPSAYLGSAGDLVDRALARHSAARS